MKKSLEQGGRCDKCKPNPCKCHPCYDVTVGDCNNTCDDTPVEVDPCVNEEFCDTQCDPVISTDCFVLPNGDTLTTHLNNLFELVSECCDRTTIILQTVREEVDSCCDVNYGCPIGDNRLYVVFDFGISGTSGSLINVDFDARVEYPNGDLSDFENFGVKIQFNDLTGATTEVSSLPGEFTLSGIFGVNPNLVTSIFIEVLMYNEIGLPVCTWGFRSADIPNPSCVTSLFDSTAYVVVARESRTCDASEIGDDGTWVCVNDPFLFINLC